MILLRNSELLRGRNIYFTYESEIEFKKKMLFFHETNNISLKSTKSTNTPNESTSQIKNNL